MNQLEMTQYIVDEFMCVDKKAAYVKAGNIAMEAIVVFTDGAEQKVNGRFAHNLLAFVKDTANEGLGE